MTLKTDGYRISYMSCTDSEKNVITLSSRFIFIMCTMILILSAVEGLNGFKKLNIKDIAREQGFYL